MRILVLACAAACATLLVVQGDERAARPMPARDRATEAIAAIAHPHQPARYRVPRDAVRVSNGRQLRAALARRTRIDIVLAPGAYDSREPFADVNGHRLYSAQLGRAVLHAGLSLGGNSGHGGALVRGVALDVSDPARTVEGAAIAVWGTGRDTRILDTTLRGRGVLPAGIVARRPDGLRLRRVVARGFTDYGVLIDANRPDEPDQGAPFIAQDIDVDGVGREVPGSSNGRAEACLWIGNSGTVRRVRLRDCAWSGLWTGTATRGARFEDVDVDATRTGVYLEHFTSDSSFTRLRVGTRVEVGLQAEWADPAWGSRPASVGNVVSASRFESALVGVYLDEGTTRTTIRDSSFVNQSWAAIGDYLGNGNAEYANDFGGIDPGAETVRHDHLSSARGE